jgi:hypothetical protein
MQKVIKLKKHYFRIVMSYLADKKMIRPNKHEMSLGFIVGYITCANAGVSAPLLDLTHFKIKLPQCHYKDLVRYIKINRIECEFGHFAEGQFVREYGVMEKEIEIW